MKTKQPADWTPHIPEPGEWRPWPKCRPPRTDPGDGAEYEVKNQFGDIANALHIYGRGWVLVNDEIVNGAGFAVAPGEITHWRRVD